jgi:hypothetical protein
VGAPGVVDEAAVVAGVDGGVGATERRGAARPGVAGCSEIQGGRATHLA